MKKTLAIILSLALLCLTLPALAAEQTTFKLDKAFNTVYVGETLQLSLIREGDALAEGELTFTSANEKRATVDGNGVVTGKAKGEVTITARLKTEKKTYKATLLVQVAVRAAEISVTEDNLPLYQPTDPLIAPLLTQQTELPVLVLRKGTSQELKISVLPKEASNRKTTMTTSDETIVRVSGSSLNPKVLGECTLTIASQQNPEIIKQYHLLVVQPVTKLQLSAPEKSIYLGGTLTLTPAFTPDDASIKAVSWSSGSEKIATVDQYGVVTGVSKGDVTIKATAVDGSKRYATYKVTVKQQAESITLKESAATIDVGKYKTLSATVMPKNTNDKSVTWISSDESVATVSSKGRVTGVAPGTCTITCQSATHPGVAAVANITVQQPVTKITFADQEISFNVNGTCQLFWQVSPDNATNSAVTFSSNNEKIATVDENGLITGHKRGSCTITVTAADGSKKKDTIKVNVLQPVEGVYMENDTLRVGVDDSITARAVLQPSDASNTRMTWTSADTSIATVRGSKNKPTITGQRWGTTTITGVTEDGGYVTSATINVGDYDQALKITDLYLQDNGIKIVVNNESNMTVTRFSFDIECYDIYDAPLACNENGANIFDGSYRRTLYEGDNTEHGRFYFDDFVQPNQPIGRVVMHLTGYSTDTGYSRSIRADRQPVLEFKTSSFVGATPTPVPVVTPAPQQPAQ